MPRLCRSATINHASWLLSGWPPWTSQPSRLCYNWQQKRCRQRWVSRSLPWCVLGTKAQWWWMWDNNPSSFNHLYLGSEFVVPFFWGSFFLQQLVSPKNGLRGRLVLEETFTDPLNQRVVHWSSMRPKLSIPWLNSWSCDANGEFLWLDDMNSWRNRWRSTRRGWWLLTRWLLRKC